MKFQSVVISPTNSPDWITLSRIQMTFPIHYKDIKNKRLSYFIADWNWRKIRGIFSVEQVVIKGNFCGTSEFFFWWAFIVEFLVLNVFVSIFRSVFCIDFLWVSFVEYFSEYLLLIFVNKVFCWVFFVEFFVSIIWWFFYEFNYWVCLWVFFVDFFSWVCFVEYF